MADARRGMRKALKRLTLGAHRAAARLGVHILPVHYYSPVPDITALAKSKELWARRSELPGIDVDLDRQIETLRQICLPVQAEYAGNAAYRHGVAHGFGPGYGYIEAQALHGVVRHYEPRRIVEVGSGVSTWCMIEALKRTRHADDASITCIEPHPSAALGNMEGMRLIEQPVQTVAFESVFQDLGANDLLFIDSSHAVKPGSDVNYLVLEILPRLAAGVIVHFHDIFLPYDYAPDALDTFFHWSETSLVRAFLIHNPRARILFCQSHLHHERPDALREIFPEYDPEPLSHGLRGKAGRSESGDARHFPASLYIQIQD
ncbi:MAG: class I SAM-dependent methyltransferase [Gemmatimonadetes bacterium]|nr:class I SAM-dependent methyltransferase [Gemmatimonadota bacterium]